MTTAAPSASPVLVLGMHRGGTSALAGALHLHGFDLGPSLMEPSEGVNSKGFWEHLDVFAIHERLKLSEVCVLPAIRLSRKNDGHFG